MSNMDREQQKAWRITTVIAANVVRLPLALLHPHTHREPIQLFISFFILFQIVKMCNIIDFAPAKILIELRHAK